jgi:hypothetical protein
MQKSRAGEKRGKVKARNRRRSGRNGLISWSKLSVLVHERIWTDDGAGGVWCMGKRKKATEVRLTIAVELGIIALPPA